MKAKVKHIFIYIILLGFGILIGWWLNELHQFAEAMANDIVRPFNLDTILIDVDTIKQKENWLELDSLIEVQNFTNQ